MGTIVVGSLLAGLVGLVVRKIIRDKKKGKNGCCGDCSRCKLGT